MVSQFSLMMEEIREKKNGNNGEKWQIRWNTDNEVSQMECKFLGKEDDTALL